MRMNKGDAGNLLFTGQYHGPVESSSLTVLSSKYFFAQSEPRESLACKQALRMGYSGFAFE